MQVDPILYYYLVGTFAAVSTVAIYLLIIHTFTSKKLEDAQKQSREAQDMAKRQYDEMVARAQTDYEALISAANKKAQEIIDNATRISQDSEGLLNKAVGEILEKQKQQLEEETRSLGEIHKQDVEKIGEENINLLNNISKDYLSFSQVQLEEFKKAVMQQTFESENKAQEKIQAEYQKVEAELTKYRQQAFKNLEEDIFNIIFNVSKEVLGKTIDITSHEELISKALENAKTQVKL